MGTARNMPWDLVSCNALFCGATGMLAIDDVHLYGTWIVTGREINLHAVTLGRPLKRIRAQLERTLDGNAAQERFGRRTLTNAHVDPLRLCGRAQ